MLAGEAVEAPEQAADEHERGPDGEAEGGAECDAAEGGAVGARDEIALHDGLVRGVLLQVEEEAVDDEHEMVGWSKRNAVLPRLILWWSCVDAMDGVRDLAGRKRREAEWRRAMPAQRTKPCTTSLQTTASTPPIKRVEDGDDCRVSAMMPDDGPAGHAGECEREQVEDEAHLGEVSDGEGEGGVEADAAAEAVAEVLVGAHADDAAEEGNDDGADEAEDADEQDAGDEE